nr:MAG TPA: hypothetical protein [Caudoviricetes sp.]
MRWIKGLRKNNLKKFCRKRSVFCRFLVYR